MNINKDGNIEMTDAEALDLAQKLIAQVASLQKHRGSYRHITEGITLESNTGRRGPGKMSFLIFPAESVK